MKAQSVNTTLSAFFNGNFYVYVWIHESYMYGKQTVALWAS